MSTNVRASGKPVARLNSGFNNAIRASYRVKNDPLIPLNALFDRRSFAGLSISSADNEVGFPAFKGSFPSTDLVESRVIPQLLSNSEMK